MPSFRQGIATGAEELALLVDAVQDYAIFLLSPTGEIRSWNRGAERIMGYPVSEVVGSHFSRFYTDPDLANRKPERELETAETEGRVEDEGWRIRKDGTRFWASTIISALRRPSGELIGFAKVTRDLTERKAAEERLRQSEELFRLLVSSVRDYAIFMLDPNGNVATWNEGAHRIKGYTGEEIIGRHFSTFYPEVDVQSGKPAYELTVARERGSVEDEGWRIRKDGSRFWANVVITAVFDEKGQLRGFAKVTRDITERKNAEEIRRSLLEQREARLQAEEERRRAEQSYAVAQEANRAKDEFLMTLSHELRTPMTAILGWARMLQALSPDDPMFNEAVGSISRSAKLQAQLIDDVLDVSRIVSGKLRLTPERIDVNLLLHSAVESVRPTADARSITLTESFSSEAGSVVADPTRIQQVIWNLLTNAIKFTPKGGRVDISAKRSASHLQICVTDSGEGIDPNFLPHVFEPFRQAESPRTRVHGGLGIGLSIVRYLTEAHGGSVSAESAGRGKGATFTVTLPIAAVTAVRPEAKPRAVSPLGIRHLAGVRLMVVDDDAETRNLLRAVFLQAGAEVATASSASGAMELLPQHHPSLIVTDIAMPGGDGYSLVGRIRAEMGRGVQVVALSAFPPGSGGGSVSEFDAWITKPVDPAELVEMIAGVVGRQRVG